MNIYVLYYPPITEATYLPKRNESAHQENCMYENAYSSIVTPNVHQEENGYVMEHLARKRNRMLMHTMTRVVVTEIMLCTRNQTRERMYYIVPFI